MILSQLYFYNPIYNMRLITFWSKISFSRVGCTDLNIHRNMVQSKVFVQLIRLDHCIWYKVLYSHYYCHKLGCCNSNIFWYRAHWRYHLYKPLWKYSVVVYKLTSGRKKKIAMKILCNTKYVIFTTTKKFFFMPTLYFFFPE